MLHRVLAALLASFVLVTTLISHAKEPAQMPATKVTGPYTHDNLAVYLIHGNTPAGTKDYLTLQEALEQKKVIVHETQEVNTLTIENVSDQDVFVQAGEIVKGGQQDRTLARDLIVSAHSGQVPIAAHCVEHGRWTQRGSEQVVQFGASNNALTSKALKQANYAGDQSKVWAEVANSQQKLSQNISDFSGKPTTSPTSLEMTVEAPQVQAASDEYVKALTSATAADSGSEDVIGYAIAINGKLNSGDVYASHVLFTKLWPKMLTAAAVEAVGERDSAEKSQDVPKCEAIAAAMAGTDAAPASEVASTASLHGHAMGGQVNAINAPAIQTQNQENSATATITTGVPEASAKDDGRAAVVKRETDQNVMYETRDAKADAPYVHRSYLAK
jgi:hypothetical protein